MAAMYNRALTDRTSFFRSYNVTSLKWDSGSGGGGESFVLADESGTVQVWKRHNGDITSWNLVATTTLDRSVFNSY